MVTLTGGHAAIHWFQQLFPVILPEIKADLRFNDLQMESLSTARRAATEISMLPSGVLADSFRRQISLLLAIALALRGLAYFLTSLSSEYLMILLSMGIKSLLTQLLVMPSPVSAGGIISLTDIKASFFCAPALLLLAVTALLAVRIPRLSASPVPSV